MANLFFRTNIAPYRVDTYNALHEKLNCKLFFMSRTDSSQNYDISKIESRCRFVPTIMEKGKFLGIPYFKNIWKILKTNKPNIVIVPEFKIITLQAIAYKFLVDRHVKIISMCDDSYDMVANGNDFTHTHSLARKIVTPLLDDLILVDNKVCQWYKQHYGKGIWMPIIRDEKYELPLYKRAQALSQKYVTEFNLEEKNVLIYVGRLAPEKNLTTLIKAVSLTKVEFATVIIGDGPMKEELQQMAKETAKEIIFPGRYDDDEIRAWFNIGDVFVLPSTTEPFGAVTNEALLGGCYVLISKACGSTCIIDDTNGRIFNPNSAEELADLIDESILNIYIHERKQDSRMNLKFDEAVVKVIENLKI